jgi:hypothetical protein
MITIIAVTFWGALFGYLVHTGAILKSEAVLLMVLLAVVELTSFSLY